MISRDFRMLVSSRGVHTDLIFDRRGLLIVYPHDCHVFFRVFGQYPDDFSRGLRDYGSSVNHFDPRDLNIFSYIP